MALPALISTATTANLQPLPPTAKWVVDGRVKDLDCVLSRDFGDADHPVALAIRPSLTGHAAVVVSFEAKTLQPFPHTIGKVTLLPGGLVVSGGRGFKYDPAAGREAVAISLKPAETRMLLSGLADASSIQVDVGDRGFLFSTGSVRSASNALAACRSKIAQALGADPAAMIHAPDGRLVQWVKPDDYQSMDRKALPENHTIVLLTISAKGKPTDCRAAVSSGRSAWDEATCRALIHRADFGATTIASGNRYAVVRVGWIELQSRLIPIAEDDF